MKKLKDAVLGTLIIIAYALKDIIIYLIYGIFIAIILYLAYYVIFGIVSYEKRYSVFKNTFNKLKNLLLSIYSKWYFESKDFFSLKDRIASYIQNCNELNAHINDLERINLNAAQRDYGQVISVDTSYMITKDHTSFQIRRRILFTQLI